MGTSKPLVISLPSLMITNMSSFEYSRSLVLQFDAYV